MDVKRALEESAAVKLKLAEKEAANIEKIGEILAETLAKGGKILLCGNGGSAADSQHLAAELVVRYRGDRNRRALPAIALTVDPSIATAGGNDIGFENVFARQVEALGQEGDALIAISTSGESENVFRAAKAAKKKGMTVVGLLGSGGGKIAAECDRSTIVPSRETARVQEAHIAIGHIWIDAIEEKLFPELFE